MAESYALEMDDLHRRWLPKEILDDIGFADDGDAPPPPAAIEGLAMHLAGILGSGARKAAAPPPTAAASPASYHNQLHRVPVCGQVLVAYGGAAGWPFTPYSSPAQWQVAAGLVNGGAVDHRRRLGSPPPKMRGGGGGGTGVFLPRTYVYHAKEESPAPAATKASSRDGKASNDLLVEEQQKQPGQGEEEEEGSPAAKAKIEQQCPPPMTGTASSEVMRVRPNAAAAAALPELAALPQEWTY
uniref:Uncharacterized protein n=1 Tax=Oryza glumipatula TaxID=40148 RepID=A0A0E0BPA8_9ORYZ